MWTLKDTCSRNLQFIFPLMAGSSDIELLCSVLQIGKCAAGHKSTEVTTWKYTRFSSLPGPKSTCYDRESIEATKAGVCLCGRKCNNVLHISSQMFMLTFNTF